VTDTGWVTQEVRDAATHVAEPSEVAEVIAYLCEDRARLIKANILHLR